MYPSELWDTLRLIQTSNKKQLVFPINAHQNANQKPIESVPAVYTFTPSYLPDPPFQFFMGPAGSKTTT